MGIEQESAEYQRGYNDCLMMADKYSDADTDFLITVQAKQLETLRAKLNATASDILRQFYTDVCDEAELIMSQTGTVSGAHYNAMKRVLKRRGVEVE